MLSYRHAKDKLKKKYMAPIDPATATPLPICMVARPFWLVVGVCVSENTNVPPGEPCRMLTFIPTVALVTRTFDGFLITA